MWSEETMHITAPVPADDRMRTAYGALRHPPPTLTALAKTVGSAAPNIRALPSGTVTCGDNKYSVSAIEAAIDAGVDDMDDGDFPGKCLFSLVMTVTHLTYRLCYIR